MKIHILHRKTNEIVDTIRAYGPRGAPEIVKIVKNGPVSVMYCYHQGLVIDARKWENALLDNLDFSGASFSNMNLQQASCISTNFNKSIINHSCFDRANMSGISMIDSRILNTSFVVSILNHADLTGTSFDDCDFSNCCLKNANLTNVTFRHCSLHRTCLNDSNFAGAELIECNMIGTDISGLREFDRPIDNIFDNFQTTSEGIIAYKIFGMHYEPPLYWEIKQGSIIAENVNPDPTTNCGCGINVGSKSHIMTLARTNKKDNVWELLIKWPWTPSIVVPYNEQHVFRVGRALLLSKIV